MKYIIYVFVIFFIAITACEHAGKNEPLNLEFEEIAINIEPGYLNYYHSGYTFKSDSGDFFIGYNRFDHSFDYFNLDQKVVLSRVFVNEEGTNAIEKPISFFAANKNYVVVRKSSGDFLSLNHKGGFLSKFNVMDIDGVEENNFQWRYQGLVFSNHQFVFLSEDNTLALKLFPTFPRSNNGYYDRYGIARIPIDRIENTKLYSLEYPAGISDTRYGDLDQPEVIIGYNDQVISSFSCSKEVTVISLENNYTPTNKTLDIKSSSFYPKTISYQEKDYMSRWKYLSSSPRLFPLVYDPYQGYYFRVVKPESMKGEFYLRNQILIFDNELNFIGSKKLPVDADVFIFPTSKGAIIPFNEASYESENRIKFYRLIIK